MGTRDGSHECDQMLHSEQYPCSKTGTITGQRSLVVCHHDRNTKDAPSRRSAIGLNHEAVTLLKSGNDDEAKALEIFKRALRLVKTDLTSGSSLQATQSWVIHHQHHNDQEQRTMTAQEEPPFPTCCGPELRLQSSCCSLHKHLRLVQLPISRALYIKEPLLLYSKAFTFQCADLVDTTCLSAETLGSAIIYNMALVLHLKGMRTNSSILLKKALHLYNMSMRLQENDVSVVLGGTTLSTLALSRSLLIACCNNIGHLASFLFDNEQVQTMKYTFHSLLTTSSSSSTMVAEQHHELLARGGPVSTMVLFDDEDMQGFKTNIIFMHPPMTAPAA